MVFKPLWLAVIYFLSPHICFPFERIFQQNCNMIFNLFYISCKMTIHWPKSAELLSGKTLEKYFFLKVRTESLFSLVKGQLVLKASCQTVNSSKNEWMNSFLLICNMFSFVFWKKLKTPKRHFEINWPLAYLNC